MLLGEIESQGQIISNSRLIMIKKCNGTANLRQKGSAAIKFDSSESKTIVLNMEGRAEASYEFFELFVDDVSKTNIKDATHTVLFIFPI